MYAIRSYYASIEYSINIFDRVLDISAVNDDGELILARMDENALRYHNVDEVVRNNFV